MERLVKDFLKEQLNAIEIESLVQLHYSDGFVITPGGSEILYDVKYIDSNECTD
jgi:hypothetical protein